VATLKGHYPFGDSWYDTGTAMPSVSRKFTKYMVEPELANSVLHASMYREHSARIGRFQSPDRARGYSFDALGRLANAATNGSANFPAWGLSWTYDRYGSRTAQSIFSGCVAPMTCPTNSVTIDATTNRITGSGYSYDANGNMTQDGVNTLTYDAENHLISSSGPGGSATYSYDGNGLRVEKAVSGGTTTVYIFSGAQVIAEYENGAAPASPTREYISSGSAPLAKIEGSSTIYYLRDHLSNRVLTDSSGNVLGESGHFPYGEQWYTSGTSTKWLFTSYERDSESGNDYAQARSYINLLGRFNSPDPIAGNPSDPQSLNRYIYVRSDPVDLTDSSGAITCGPATCPPPPPEPVLDVGFLLFALGYYPSWRQFLPLGNFDPPGGGGGFEQLPITPRPFNNTFMTPPCIPPSTLPWDIRLALGAMSLASRLTGVTYFAGLQASGTATGTASAPGMGVTAGGSVVYATDPQGNQSMVISTSAAGTIGTPGVSAGIVVGGATYQNNSGFAGPSFGWEFNAGKYLVPGIGKVSNSSGTAVYATASAALGHTLDWSPSLVSNGNFVLPICPH
jgi:RHS repeat-associated protein